MHVFCNLGYNIYLTQDLTVFFISTSVDVFGLILFDNQRFAGKIMSHPIPGKIIFLSWSLSFKLQVHPERPTL